MELKNFIGKVVISSKTKTRYTLNQITSPYIEVVTEKPDERGYHTHRRFKTINGDPISENYIYNLYEGCRLDKRIFILYNEITIKSARGTAPTTAQQPTLRQGAKG